MDHSVLENTRSILYAVQIKLGEGDWLYLTEDTGKCMDLQPVIFKTFEEATQACSIWDCAKVVEYDDDWRLNYQ